MRARAGLVAVLVVTVAACSGGGGGSTLAITAETTAATDTVVTEPAATEPAATNPTDPATAAATQPQTTTKPKTKVGSVTITVPNGGHVNQAEANDGDAIAAQDVIDANANGQVRFEMGKALPSCSVDGDSAVQVQPGGGALLAVRQGVVSCITSTSGTKNFVAGDTVVTAVDPVVVIGYDGQHATVKVAQGHVRVRAPEGTTILGADQQTQVGGGQSPSSGPWEPSELPAANAEYVNGLVTQAVKAARPPSYPRLSTNGSPTLQRAVARKSFVVGLVGDDDVAVGVAQSLVEEFLSHGVALSVEVGRASEDDAVAGLGSGQVDLVVSTRLSGNQGIPLFTVGDTLYRAATSSDDGSLRRQLQSFLSAALQAECSRSAAAPAAAPGQSCYEHAYRDGGGDEFVPQGALGAYLGLG